MTHEVLDNTVLAELEETVGADFVDELVTTFLEEGPGMVAELRTAAEAGDTEAARRAAHSLKSNANTFGAGKLAEVARKIELDGISESHQDQIDAVVQAWDEASSALSARKNA